MQALLTIWSKKIRETGELTVKGACFSVAVVMRFSIALAGK